LVILIADARHTQTRNDTMPFVLDGLNMIFLAAAAIFGGTIIKANPDLTKPHPDSAFGKWQAKRQEKVSHETSRLPWVLPSRVATGDARARRGTRDRSRDTRVTRPTSSHARVSPRDPHEVAKPSPHPSSPPDRPPLTPYLTLSIPSQAAIAAAEAEKAKKVRA
jgi:hypothetical protein